MKQRKRIKKNVRYSKAHEEERKLKETRNTTKDERGFTNKGNVKQRI